MTGMTQGGWLDPEEMDNLSVLGRTVGLRPEDRGILNDLYLMTSDLAHEVAEYDPAARTPLDAFELWQPGLTLFSPDKPDQDQDYLRLAGNIVAQRYLYDLADAVAGQAGPGRRGLFLVVGAERLGVPAIDRILSITHRAAMSVIPVFTKIEGVARSETEKVARRFLYGDDVLPCFLRMRDPESREEVKKYFVERYTWRSSHRARMKSTSAARAKVFGTFAGPQGAGFNLAEALTVVQAETVTAGETRVMESAMQDEDLMSLGDDEFLIPVPRPQGDGFLRVGCDPSSFKLRRPDRPEKRSR
jgi:hypothetical protein